MRTGSRNIGKAALITLPMRYTKDDLKKVVELMSWIYTLSVFSINNFELTSLCAKEHHASTSTSLLSFFVSRTLEDNIKNRPRGRSAIIAHPLKSRPAERFHHWFLSFSSFHFDDD